MRYRPLRAHRGARQQPVPRGDDVRAVGQPRPRRVDRGHPRRPRRRHQLHRHRRRVLGRRVGGDRRQGDRRPARRHRARHQVLRADGQRPQHGRRLASLDHARVRGQPAPPEHRPPRPVPGAPSRSERRHRRDARRAERPRAPGQGALPRQLHLARVGDRRGAVGRRAAQPRAVRVRAAAVLDPRARHRGRRAADVPAARHGRDPVEPARRWLVVGQVARRAASRSPATAPTASRRATTSTNPATSRSSRRPTRSGSWPTTPASRSCTSRWRGCCATRR